jgi:hypothetical protein
MKKVTEFLKLGEVFGYFVRVFQKPDPSRPDSSSLRMMHGINRISILMFLFCLCVMLYRFFAR